MLTYIKFHSSFITLWDERKKKILICCWHIITTGKWPPFIHIAINIRLLLYWYLLLVADLVNKKKKHQQRNFNWWFARGRVAFKPYIGFSMYDSHSVIIFIDVQRRHYYFHRRTCWRKSRSIRIWFENKKIKFKLIKMYQYSKEKNKIFTIRGVWNSTNF